MPEFLAEHTLHDLPGFRVLVSHVAHGRNQPLQCDSVGLLRESPIAERTHYLHLALGVILAEEEDRVAKQEGGHGLTEVLVVRVEVLGGVVQHKLPFLLQHILTRVVVEQVHKAACRKQLCGGPTLLISQMRHKHPQVLQSEFEELEVLA